MSRVNADEGQLTDERVSHDLERQRRERLLVIGLAGNLFPGVGINALGFRRVQRGRQEIDHCIQQWLHAFVLESGTDDNREQLQRDGRLAQRSAQRVCADFFAFQKLMQNLVVVLSDGLDQLGVKRFRFLLQLSRDRLGNVLRAHGLVRPDDRLHIDQINDALELVFLADWNLDRYRFGVKALADGVDGMLKISTHLVDFVNETNSRDAVLVGLPPYLFRLRLYAVNGVKYRDGAIEHAQRTLHLGREIHVPRRVD